MDDNADKYIELSFTAGNDKITLKTPYTDLVYKDSNNKFVVSVGNLTTWKANGSVPADAEFALGRQFVVNTYLNFRVFADQAGAISSYEIQVGQLLDLGKITPKERLGLLIFGCAIVAIILIVLVIKLCSQKKVGSGDYVRQDA